MNGPIVEPMIKAISLYQPWASLMVLGKKQFETRSWGTRYKGLVVICASKTLEVDWFNTSFIAAMRADGIDDPRKLPLGVALGIGELVGCYKAESVYPHISEHERLYGNYAAGRLAFEFKNVKLFSQPLPVRGQLGLWDWKQPLPDVIEPVPF